ncbi:MAG: hypothetical protein KDJ90_07490 [Nitratireductor sp.]|nr:hypothetical protein [Nitratireductor sp.]
MGKAWWRSILDLRPTGNGSWLALAAGMTKKVVPIEENAEALMAQLPFQ